MKTKQNAIVNKQARNPDYKTFVEKDASALPESSPTTADRDSQREYGAEVTLDLTTGKIRADGFHETARGETQQPNVKIDGGYDGKPIKPSKLVIAATKD